MFLHVRLKVRDMSRTIEFYQRHFGMICRDQKTSPRGSQLAFMSMPGSPTELELAYLPWDPDFKLDEDILHLAFKVEEMETAIAQFKEAGVKITEAPSPRKDGGWMAFIEDPNGYEIELLSFGLGQYEALQEELNALVKP